MILQEANRAKNNRIKEIGSGTSAYRTYSAIPSPGQPKKWNHYMDEKKQTRQNPKMGEGSGRYDKRAG